MIFDKKHFAVAYSIWWLGLIISVLPMIISYWAFLTKTPDANEGFIKFFFKSPELLYSLVSVSVVAFADLILDIVSKKEEFHGFKIVLMVIQIAIILFEALAYAFFTYTEHGLEGTLYNTGKGLFFANLILCFLTYVLKCINTNKE